MGRKLSIIFISLSFIFLNSSNVFGDDRCIHLGEDRTTEFLPEYTCKKVGDYFCYSPNSDNTLAPQGQKNYPMDSISDQEFSSKFGGCHLSIGYPQNTIWATFNGGEVVEFTKACGEVDYFLTKMDITYEAYGKGNPVAQTQETKTNQKIPISGYHSPLVAKINEFKTGVNDYIYDRDIYTLRVKEAVITDDKCPTKHKIEDRPISVATKLLLELRLNADDKIVYDDKETKKIEVNADQDESNGGTTYAD